MALGIRKAVGRFFYETFRPRKKEDYAAALKRGYGNAGKNLRYPWLYTRVFAALFLVFAIYGVICCAVDASFYYRTMYAAGAAIIDAAFLTLLYELYPEDDLSLFALSAVCVLGGTASTFISSIIYELAGNPSGWLLALTAGVGEEFAKAVPAIVCVAAMKKKDNPLAGFLIGAAVGTWFSITENVAYIAANYKDYVKILTALGRALSAPFSHAAWSAIICWAFCKFRKPFLNFKFYGLTALCMALHFLCDMPLLDRFPLVLILILACAAEAAITLSFEIYILISERKKAFTEANLQGADEDAPKFTRERRLNAFLTCGGAVFCALALVLSSVFDYTYAYEKIPDERFHNAQQFVEFAQNGLILNPDRNRPFDPDAENSNEEFGDSGLLTYAEQTEFATGNEFVYCYRLTPAIYPDGTEESKYLLTTIYLVTQADEEEKIFTPLTVHYFTYGEAQYRLYVFNLNEQADEVSIGLDEDGEFIFYKGVNGRKILTWQSVLTICLTATSAAVTFAGWLILKKKEFKNNEARDDRTVRIG